MPSSARILLQSTSVAVRDVVLNFMKCFGKTWEIEIVNKKLQGFRLAWIHSLSCFRGIFFIKLLYLFLVSAMQTAFSAKLASSRRVIRTFLGEKCKLWRSSLRNFLHSRVYRFANKCVSISLPVEKISLVTAVIEFSKLRTRKCRCKPKSVTLFNLVVLKDFVFSVGLTVLVIRDCQLTQCVNN